MSKEAFGIMCDDSTSIILKSVQEIFNTETLKKIHIVRTITIKGMTKGHDYGKLKKGGYGNPTIKKEVIYYKDQVGEDVIEEIDKFNGKAVINPLYLGGRKAGHNKWIISSVSNELKTFYKNGKPILIVANVTFKEYLSVKEKKKSKHKRVAVKNKKRKKKVAKTSSNKKQNTNSSKSKKASSSKSKKKRVSSKTSGGYITYTLKKTDTLWNLAKKYYGSGGKYKKIYNANKSLQQGYKLKPGSTIRIPKK